MAVKSRIILQEFGRLFFLCSFSFSNVTTMTQWWMHICESPRPTGTGNGFNNWKDALLMNQAWSFEARHKSAQLLPQ